MYHQQTHSLNSLINQLQQQPLFRQLASKKALYDAWKASTPPYAHTPKSLIIKHHNLYVQVGEPLLRYELLLQKTKLLQHINEILMKKDSTMLPLKQLFIIC